jgi:hypothetical protein
MAGKAVAFEWQADLRISLWFASFARRSDEMMPLKVVALADISPDSTPRFARAQAINSERGKER